MRQLRPLVVRKAGRLPRRRVQLEGAEGAAEGEAGGEERVGRAVGGGDGGGGRATYAASLAIWHGTAPLLLRQTMAAEAPAGGRGGAEEGGKGGAV